MQTIAISSFKGGTAKTSTALHIGAALSKFHKKKVLADRFRCPSKSHDRLGFDPDENDSLAPVLQGTKEIKDVILQTTSSPIGFDSRRYLARAG